MSGSEDWHRLGECAPTALVDARLQVHWAAQLVSAVGTTLLPPAADDSHTNLEWLAVTGLLAGRLTETAPRCRAALSPSDLTLCLLDEHGARRAQRGLHAWTFEQGMNWLSQEIAAFTKRPLPRPLHRRELELPDHAVARGATFSLAEAAAFAELGRWYANADAVLRALADHIVDASPVRCWPHHFDIATLVTVHRGANAEPGATIGIGMSPGDAECPQPYWYVTPWPAPSQRRLTPLDGGGVWHEAGWFGAVLTGTRLVAAGAASEQVAQVDAFLRSAVDACRKILDART